MWLGMLEMGLPPPQLVDQLRYLADNNELQSEQQTFVRLVPDQERGSARMLPITVFVQLSNRTSVLQETSGLNEKHQVS